MLPRNWARHLSGFLLAIIVLSGSALGRESEAELLQHIQREQNPVRKARLEIKLADLKLQQAGAAYGKGDVEAGAKLLETFLGQMKSAWKALQESGRMAHKQPEGFKELDIALREDARSLEDLKRRIAYFDRGPVEKCIQEIEGIRSEVLHALFPAAKPRTGNAPAAPRNSTTPATAARVR